MAALECICPPGQRDRGTYTIGCPACTEAAATRPPSATYTHVVRTVEVLRASVKIHRPVLKDGEVWTIEETIECEHHHGTPEAAERCAIHLAAQAGIKDRRPARW